MHFKFVYAKGAQLSTTIIEAPSVKEAMRRGYAQCQWDSVLELTTKDDHQLIFPPAGAHPAPAPH